MWHFLIVDAECPCYEINIQTYSLTNEEADNSNKIVRLFVGRLLHEGFDKWGALTTLQLATMRAINTACTVASPPNNYT